MIGSRACRSIHRIVGSPRRYQQVKVKTFLTRGVPRMIVEATFDKTFSSWLRKQQRRKPPLRRPRRRQRPRRRPPPRRRSKALRVTREKPRPAGLLRFPSVRIRRSHDHVPAASWMRGTHQLTPNASLEMHLQLITEIVQGVLHAEGKSTTQGAQRSDLHGLDQVVEQCAVDLPIVNAGTFDEFLAAR